MVDSMTPDECRILPSFDSIESNPESIVSTVAISIEGLVLVFALFNLGKLLNKSFSYKKNGLYEAIQLHVIGVVGLLVMILSRAFSISSYSYKWSNQAKVEQMNSNKIFGNLLACLSILFMNDIYLFMSIIWLRFAYEVEKMRKYKRLRLAIKIFGPYLLNLGSAISILYVHVFLSPNKKDSDYENPNYIKYSMYILLLSTSVTQAIFSYASYKIYIKSRDSGFREYSETNLRRIRIGVLVIYVLSLVRLVFFFLQMLSDPVSLRRFNKKDCIDTSIGWAVGILVESVFLTIPPVLAFVIFLKDRFKRIRNPLRSNLMQSAFLEW